MLEKCPKSECSEKRDFWWAESGFRAWFDKIGTGFVHGQLPLCLLCDCLWLAALGSAASAGGQCGGGLFGWTLNCLQHAILTSPLQRPGLFVISRHPSASQDPELSSFPGSSCQMWLPPHPPTLPNPLKICCVLSFPLHYLLLPAWFPSPAFLLLCLSALPSLGCFPLPLSLGFLVPPKTPQKLKQSVVLK